MTSRTMGVKIASPKFSLGAAEQKEQGKKEEMVMLCSQHGVEIKAGLNIASEGLNHLWGKGLNERQVKAKALKGKLPSSW